MRLCVAVPKASRPAGCVIRGHSIKVVISRYRMYLTIFSAQWHQFTFADQNVCIFIFSGRYSLRSFNISLPIQELSEDSTVFRMGTMQKNGKPRSA